MKSYLFLIFTIPLYAGDQQSETQPLIMQEIAPEQGSAEPDHFWQGISTGVSTLICLVSTPLGALLCCARSSTHIYDCFDAVDDCNPLHARYVAPFRATREDALSSCFVCCPCLYDQVPVATQPSHLGPQEE